MKIEEAKRAMHDLAVASGIGYYDRALSVIIEHLEAKVVVDDAMVERALNAWDDFREDGQWTSEKAMRAAIQAAVGGDDA